MTHEIKLDIKRDQAQTQGMQRPQRPQRRKPTGRPVLVQPTGDPPSPFMTAKDVAALLGVSDDTVTRAVREGAIPGFKLKSTYRIFRAFVDDVYAEICSGRGVVIEDYAKSWQSQIQAVA